MGKTIDLGLAKRDDPIYKSGPMISGLKLPQSTQTSQPATAGTAPAQKQKAPPPKK